MVIDYNKVLRKMLTTINPNYATEKQKKMINKLLEWRGITTIDNN